MALTFAAKEATWLRLLLIEIGLLDEEGQYAEIKVTQGSIGAEQIQADAAGQMGGAPSMTLTSNAAPAPLPSLTNNNSSASLSLKGDNQGSIAFAHNPVFHARTRPIDIQHHYIRDEVAAGRIDLQYISNVRDDCK